MKHQVPDQLRLCPPPFKRKRDDAGGMVAAAPREANLVGWSWHLVEYDGCPRLAVRATDAQCELAQWALLVSESVLPDGASTDYISEKYS